MIEHQPVIVQMVVHNGKSWLPTVLDSLRTQTYSNFKVMLLDSASTDGTGEFIAHRYPEVRVIRSDENVGFWRGTEMLLEYDRAPFVLALTDVELAPEFIEYGVRCLESSRDIGAVQSRMMQGTWVSSGLRRENMIDSLGFAVSHSRRVTNRGHGDPDRLWTETYLDIFGVEGAAPFFRRSALEYCRIQGRLIDPDYRIGPLGYGDDLDLAWRMRILGYRQVLVPAMLAWHDRSTTKGVAHSAREYLSRRKLRQKIPLLKRQLDWANVRFTILKNDYIQNVVRDFPKLVLREVLVLGYTLAFEPRMFAIVPRFVRLIPNMLRKRHAIMQRATAAPSEMHRLFT